LENGHNYELEVQMIMVRTAQSAPGKLGELMSFAKEIAAYLKSKHGIDVKVMMQAGGPAGRICWLVQYKSLSDYENSTNRILADPDYHKIAQNVAGLVIAGQTNDSLWREIWLNDSLTAAASARWSITS
jgi:NIPSNAP